MKIVRIGVIAVLIAIVLYTGIAFKAFATETEDTTFHSVVVSEEQAEEESSSAERENIELNSESFDSGLVFDAILQASDTVKSQEEFIVSTEDNQHETRERLESTDVSTRTEQINTAVDGIVETATENQDHTQAETETQDTSEIDIETQIEEETPQPTYARPQTRAFYQDSSGRWLYLDNNGQPHTGWIVYQGYRFYFYNGYALPGWQTLGGNRYYFYETGQSPSGWLVLDGKYYYFDPNTSVASAGGWQELDGKWYYFNPDGSKYAGWLQQDGRTYYIHPQGQMAQFWTVINNEWYYFSEDGTAYTGWVPYSTYRFYYQNGKAMPGRQVINGQTYYFTTAGQVLAGWNKLGDDWYYADPQTGAAANGWTTVNGRQMYFEQGIAAQGWKTINGKKYYFTNGYFLTGWRQIDGTWYYFGTDGSTGSGVLQYNDTYYFIEASGKMLTDSIQTIDGEDYYFTNTGYRLKGWLNKDGKWYYFKPETGQMVKGTNYTINGRISSFDAKGVWQGYQN
ncbi:hypothetical protein FACS189418_6630 [Clostridia bacterium]|nr:hypothetical protein FACS189418_6630 [Clostridia bacterium]